MVNCPINYSTSLTKVLTLVFKLTETLFGHYGYRYHLEKQMLMHS